MKRCYLLILPMLFSCANLIKEEKIELDYSVILESDFIRWEDLFEKEEESYKVYFYSETCGYCKKLKEDILSYYLLNKERLYFCNTDTNNVVLKSNDEYLIGCDNIEDFFIPGTPYLVSFIKNKVEEIYKGLKQIKEYIDKHRV